MLLIISYYTCVRKGNKYVACSVFLGLAPLNSIIYNNRHFHKSTTLLLPYRRPLPEYEYSDYFTNPGVLEPEILRPGLIDAKIRIEDHFGANLN